MHSPQVDESEVGGFTKSEAREKERDRENAREIKHRVVEGGLIP